MGIKWLSFVLLWTLLFSLTSLPLFQSVFVFSINFQSAQYPYLYSPSTFPPVDKLISKQILGMLWHKYNGVSQSQLLDHAVKDSPVLAIWKKCKKELVFTSRTENLDLCLMWIPLQWCNKIFYRKTPHFFFPFSDSTPTLSSLLLASTVYLSQSSWTRIWL